MKLFKKSIMFLIVLATSLCCFVLGTNEVRAAKGDSYELVTDVANLTVGDTIIIVASGSNVALSTTQNNNRPAIAITKNENQTIDFVEGIQDITLENGKVDGTFAFNVGTGYLYAASSSKNYLKIESNLSNNSSWKIEINGEGVATIKAQGTNTHNWLRYNNSNGSSLFSCYEKGQNNVSIYKKLKNESLPQLSAPVVSVEGKVASWNAIEGAVEYSVGVYESVESTIAKYENKTNETSYDFSNIVSVGTWYIKVKAVADNVTSISSDYSSNEVLFTNSVNEINCTPTEFLSYVDFNASVTFVVKGTLNAFYTSSSESANNNYSSTNNYASFYLTDGTSKVRLCKNFL